MSSNHSPGGSGQEPEYLESGGGGPLAAPPATPPGRRGPGAGWIVGGLVGLLVVLGAAGWAAWSFFASGPQPAEALPASTIVYASVDLDPSGGQKIEALRTLRKFPAFEDEIGLDTDDDIRKRIFEEIQGSGTCESLDYGEDVEPWLGDRVAAAAVDVGEDAPAWAVVLQVRDEDAADSGLSKIAECGDATGSAWAIEGGWALLGESQELVDEMAEAAADAPLSDDDDYTTWTEAAGDDGIASLFVAPAAGRLLADALEGWVDPLSDPTDPMVPSEMTTALEDFGGLAATLRFADGSIELEVAADAGDAQQALGETGRGGDVLATLPEGTGAAIGVGLAEGWAAQLVEQMSGELDAEDLLEEFSAQSGLDLPEDLETLLGESAALAVDGSVDFATLAESPDGSGVPVGLKVRGDAAAIESVLEGLRPQFGDDQALIDSDSDGDLVVIGPDADYRARLLEDGDLGDSDVFQNVVREAGQAAAILYVDFDAGDWLAGVADGDAELADNLAPLQGLGLSTWVDDGASHLVLRVTTD